MTIAGVPSVVYCRSPRCSTTCSPAHH